MNDDDELIDLTELDPSTFLAEPEPESSLPAISDPELPPEWGITTPKRKAQLQRSKAVRSVKHGLLSSIPMVCRDSDCPYKDHCEYQQRGEVTRGERCILEIGKLIKASEQYYNEFGVDPTNPEHRTDAVLIQELLTYEILIDRAMMLLATQNLVEEVDAAMNPQGDVIQQPQLHKAAEFLPKLHRKRDECLQLLAATRKDKLAAAASIGMSIDQFTKTLIDRAQMIDARLAAMRDGNTLEAERLGMDYAIQTNSELNTQALPIPSEEPEE